MIQDFKGKTAVLTGAGSGFGLECARIGAARGMNLVLVDVQPDALARAEAEMTAAGAQVLARRVDVSSAEQMEALATEVRDRFGAPHFVFNNAGVGAGGLLWENTVADWNWVLGVDLWGVIHGVRLFVPMMLEAAAKDPAYRGHVTNTASMAGLVAPPNMGIYNTAKAAVVNLTETLYHDLNLVTDQIGASLLCPYFVPTGITHSERNRPAGEPEAPLTRSQQIGRALTEKAVTSGKVTAEQVAQKVFAAIGANQFYVFSHESPRALGNISSRMQNMVEMRNPVDPFVEAPEVGARLRAALRASGG
ncbi:MAG TPA: SDR family oxidoreductase [Ottowia sp.]|jgi:NAD(P)-dependent dehydrogenase (short-subunit alcohol dehydrogenase family)|nr:SDR family oxidoreductase [Ottowia sp.]HQZ55665.1 SDR family oxidoreductase [Ottowia sp.]HRB09534.1 SDR family oxidoreductase [Ottowia sp.]